MKNRLLNSGSQRKIYIISLVIFLVLGGGANALSNDGGGSWTFSRDITINNPGAALSDYQVLLTLDNSNFPTDAQASGADIRFTDISNAELPYYIESWDSISHSAKIWVKIPSIPSGTTTISMYYGNPSASSSSNGDATFEFFDDFDDNSLDTIKWSQDCIKGTPYSTITCQSRIIEQNNVLEMNLNSDRGYDTRATLSSNEHFNEGTAIRYNFKNGDSWNYLYKHQALVSSTETHLWGLNNIQWGWMDWGPLMFYYRNEADTTENVVKQNIQSDNYWFTGEFIYYEDKTVRGIMTRSDGVSYGNVLFNTVFVESPRYLLFATSLWHGGLPSKVYYDDVLVRKYSEPEPSVSVGDETLADAVAPETVISLSGTTGNNGWYTDDITVTLSAADNEGGSGVAITEYTLDENTWLSYSGSFIIADEGTTTIGFRSVDNADNTESTKTQNVKLDKTGPTISINTPEPFALYTSGTMLDFSASDLLSGLDGTAVGHLTDISGIPVDVSTGHPPEPGVYTLVVEASDNAGNPAISDPVFFVIYDPDGGFATGGGWFTPDSESTISTGKATFGFVAKYKNMVSTGNLEFQYKDAGLNLKSTTIDWLVISGVSAQFQGTATINGDGLYTFRVQSKDNGEPGAGIDEFDIRIWEGTDITQEPVHKAKNTIEGGNIKVHKK